jgi:hypothetical protein
VNINFIQEQERDMRLQKDTRLDVGRMSLNHDFRVAKQIEDRPEILICLSLLVIIEKYTLKKDTLEQYLKTNNNYSVIQSLYNEAKKQCN